MKKPIQISKRGLKVNSIFNILVITLIINSFNTLTCISQGKEELIKMNIEFSESDFIYFIQKGDTGIVKKILAAGMSPNVNHGTEMYTALQEAVAIKNTKIVKMLIAAGADVNTSTISGLTALLVAGNTEQDEVTEMLLNAGANPDLSMHNNKENILHVTTKKGSTSIVKIVLKYKPNINLKNNYGDTPLNLASLNGHLEIVKLLLKNGADVNIRNNDNATALIAASMKGNKEIVSELINAGADVNIVSNLSSITALIAATIMGHDQIVKILLEAGADGNAKSDGETAVQIAIRKGYLNVVKVIIDYNSEIDVKNKKLEITSELISEAGKTLLYDKRDGNKYLTGKIENQIWMLQNLAYKPDSGTYWTYNDDNSYIKKYGYLYCWETAKNVCPVGWHLPSKLEFETLLKMTWTKQSLTGGANDLIQNFLPQFSGNWSSISKKFGDIDIEDHLWSNTPIENNAFELWVYKPQGKAQLPACERASGLSVRCIKD